MEARAGTDTGRDDAVLRTLLAGVVDYAGLFPPAGLDMADAVANYARYRTCPDRWALGRFVVNASRLGCSHAGTTEPLQ